MAGPAFMPEPLSVRAGTRMMLRTQESCEVAADGAGHASAMRGERHVPAEYFLGVDPGRKGGWGIVSRDGDAVAAGALPYQDKRLDCIGLQRDWGRALELTGVVGMAGKIHLCIEHPLTRGGESPSGLFNSGMNFGLIIAAGQAFGASLTTPMPHVWKQRMRLSDNKALSMKLSDELFPAMYNTIRGPRGGALDGVAEAILIAEYARRADLRIKSNERGGLSDLSHSKANDLVATAAPGSLLEWAEAD